MINLPEVLITDYLVVKKMNLIEDNKIENRQYFNGREE